MTTNELKTSPEQYFSSWKFEILPCHWELLGICRQRWIDRERSAIKRSKIKKELIIQGLSEKEAHKISMKSGTLYRYGWGRCKINPSNFSEGYSFHSKKRPWQIQIYTVKDGNIIFLVFDKEKKRYTSLFSIENGLFTDYLRDHDESLIKPFNPYNLTDSKMKFTLIESLKN